MSTTHSSGPMTASEFTQRTMMSDLLEQKSLLIGVGITIAALWFFMSRRPAREEEAARRLVRDWRHVDDIDDARDLIGSNVPAIIRPALLIILAELERQIQHGFRRLERTIQRL
jgi:hypothetical protein